MTQANVAMNQQARLMSGVTIEDLALPDALDVRPTGGTCGAIIHGIDLSDDLSGDVIGGLLAVLCHAGMIILPGQDRLTPERQAVVTEWFGRPFVRDSGVDRMATVNTTPVQILGSQAADPGSNVPAADVDLGRKLGPHSDVQDYQVTPDITILHGVETPPPSAGGNTYWANLYQAYEELDDETKQLVEHMQWMPASTQATAYRVGMQAAKESVAKDGLQLESEVRHPVVRTHPVTGQRSLHKGIDIDGDVGDAVVSAQDGTVFRTGRDSLNGKYIKINHDFGIQTVYCHLDRVDVKSGQQVERGAIIGALGQTGRVTGSHLHFGLKLNNKPVNPQLFGRVPLNRAPRASATRRRK